MQQQIHTNNSNTSSNTNYNQRYQQNYNNSNNSSNNTNNNNANNTNDENITQDNDTNGSIDFAYNHSDSMYNTIHNDYSHRQQHTSSRKVSTIQRCDSQHEQYINNVRHTTDASNNGEDEFANDVTEDEEKEEKANISNVDTSTEQSTSDDEYFSHISKRTCCPPHMARNYRPYVKRKRCF